MASRRQASVLEAVLHSHSQSFEEGAHKYVERTATILAHLAVKEDTRTNERIRWAQTRKESGGEPAEVEDLSAPLYAELTKCSTLGASQTVEGCGSS